ncbi:MAG: hypothetical protein C0506_14115 [Anaerolinea sp.]|nr:hypothetical protein [Anaerolinea sp.]
MAVTPPPIFDHAARHETDLNGRQREVLRLIAAGLTNGEIAERLNISLAGAKWNVSEILSKLGLDSREQAAAYYHWRRRHRLPSSLLRGFGALVSWKAGATAASVAIAVGGLAVTWALLSAGAAPDTGPAAPGLPFYMEADLTREDTDHLTRQDVRWWFDSDTVGRYEADVPRVERARPGFVVDYGQGTQVVGRDGTYQWEGPNAPTYIREALTSPAPALRPWPMSGRLGPLAFPNLDAFLADPRTSDAGWAAVTGKARILGRAVVVVETGSLSYAGSVPARVVQRRLWIDPERMFLMRSESVGSPIHEGAEVTLLRYGEDQPDPLFVFTPAPGAVEIVCRGPAPYVAGVPGEGFIAIPPAARPAGFEIGVIGVSAARDGTCGSAKVVLWATPDRAADTREIEVNESIENPASLLLSPVLNESLAGGTPAYTGIDDKGYLTLAWMQGSLGMQVASNFLTIDELRSFANAIVAEHEASTAPPAP